MESLFNVLSNYDFEQGYNQTFSSYTMPTMPSFEKDRNIIISELRKTEVFKSFAGRYHASFPKFHCNPIRQLNLNKFKEWIMTHADAKGYKLS